MTAAHDEQKLLPFSAEHVSILTNELDPGVTSSALSSTKLLE